MSNNDGVILNDDELANVTGGEDGNVNCKYPVGTKFIHTGSKTGEVQNFIEITSVEMAYGMIMYKFVNYAICGTTKTSENLITNIPEIYFDNILEEGLFEIYNG